MEKHKLSHNVRRLKKMFALHFVFGFPLTSCPFGLVQVEKHELSHNVRRFRFALQSPQHRFGLPVGKHVFLYAK